MANRDRDLYLLQLSGEEYRSLEDKRWIYIWTSIIPLVGLTITYFFQLSQPIQEPYVIYGFPIIGLLLITSVLWNIFGGFSPHIEKVVAVVVCLSTLAQNLSFVLKPDFPVHPLYINSGSYWTLALVAGFIFTALSLRQAIYAVCLLYLVVVSLPWLLNPHAFQPYAVPLFRSQGITATVLLMMGCLAWYRQRFVERATEALLLRRLALTDLFPAEPRPPKPAEQADKLS